MSKNLPVEKIQEAENCRALFLSVIYQAILDSEKKDKNARRDLPRAIYTEWWKQLFIFAGIENDLEKVNKIIVTNCNKDLKKPAEQFQIKHSRNFR